jgi:hypothetical protein
MTQEQKGLLLKDLCARLPYGIKAEIKYHDGVWGLCSINPNGYTIVTRDIGYPMETDWVYCKPYLFPLSSMTEEQKYDFYCRFIENDCDFDDFKELYLDNGMWHKLLTSIDDCDSVVDWFNKNNFDYRGLIPMGLAIDATGLNIY